jgi:hypothetical protein
VTSITAPGAVSGDIVPSPPLGGSVRAVGGRTYTFNVSCEDAAHNAASSSVDVFVVPDTTAPSIASVSATPNNLWPPDDRMALVNVSVSATDDVDATPQCALSNIGGVVAPDDAQVVGPLAVNLRATGGRTYTLTVSCSDVAGNTSSKSATVVVPPDTTAPVITALYATPNTIWPPNGKWVPVEVMVSATDDVTASPSCGLVAVYGAAANQYVLTGPFSANLRADKDTVYTLKMKCSDNAGNSSFKTTTVSVTNKDDASPYGNKKKK